ncbi:Uncharacterised protein [Kingella potus]|uniref:Phage associated protein n=1 Tax=Kingella potus TaxID=265175 RepID=A0A377QXD2_9NEIS|nr:hypothetical protein [Kingella potus]UOP02038.1 hypothetical protein LVJ84_14395 [Kingella potus]STQ99863.1 Uncharacterised protein [Kingella potus]
MANANTEHSKKLRQQTAAKWQREKLASGERRTMTINGKAAEMDIIDAAIAKAGGSRTQALLKICKEWLGE